MIRGVAPPDLSHWRKDGTAIQPNSAVKPTSAQKCE